MKENKQPEGNEEASAFQEGADSSNPEDTAPKKNLKK